MKPPPPMPLIHGSSTPMAKAAVTAASTAFPPCRSTSSAARTDLGCLAATIPFFATARSRVMRCVVSRFILPPLTRAPASVPTEHFPAPLGKAYRRVPLYGIDLWAIERYRAIVTHRGMIDPEAPPLFPHSFQ